MSASVLGHLSLGYQWVWSRQREARAVQLCVEPDTDAAVDAVHLLDLITQTWSGARVAACTLIPYDLGFDMGATLAQAAAPVALNHPHCARFCVLGNASCAG